MNSKAEAEVDLLVSKLMGPTYVLNMAKPGEYLDTSWGKSCRTRAKRARMEIDKIVTEYVEGSEPF